MVNKVAGAQVVVNKVAGAQVVDQVAGSSGGSSGRIRWCWIKWRELVLCNIASELYMLMPLI